MIDRMGLLNPTAKDRLCDARGRPYFLWDVDIDVARFRDLLGCTDPVVRAHFTAKMMRQAKPDDVFEFVTLADIVRDWSLVQPQLGKRREFWSWLLERWDALTDAA
jgi:hypothetical protein